MARAPTPEPDRASADSRAPTPRTRWPAEDLACLGSESLGRRPPLSSRTPTPLQWAREHALRSNTPLAHVQRSLTPRQQKGAASALAPLPPTPRSASALGGHTGALSAAAALELAPQSSLPSRSRSVCHGGLPPVCSEAPECTPPCRPTSASRAEHPSFYHELFGRPPPAEHSEHDLRLSRSPPPGSHAPLAPRAPPGLRPGLGEQRQPRGERRVLCGGIPRRPRRAAGLPPRISAPAVRPHNAWSTFVEWTPPDGADDPSFSYELNCRMEDAEHVLLLTDIGQEAHMQINGLEAGRAYRFQVRGRNEFGEGPWSHWSAAYSVPEPLREPAKDVVSRALEGFAPPKQPRTHSDSPTTVVLQWEEPCSHGAQILGYRVQYGPDPNDPNTIDTATVLDGSASMVVSDLAPNRRYHFRVCAINQAGDSAWSEWTDAVGMQAVVPERLSPPRIFEALSRELVIKWDEPAACGFEVIRYDVRVAREDETMMTAVLLSGTGAETRERMLHVRDLQPSTAYHFQVRSETAVGPSEWSDVSEPLVTLPEVPETCPELRVVNNVVRAITLEWKAPESFRLPITSFLLRWYEHDVVQLEKGRLHVDAAPGLRKGDTCTAEIPVSPGSRLCFEVAATSDAGLGHFSARSGEVAAAPNVPERPEPPTCALRTAGSFLVTVADTTEDNGGPISHYELRYGLSQDMRDMVTCTGSMRLGRPATRDAPRLFEHPVTGLHERRGPYYFSVRAVNVAGHSPWSLPSVAQMLRAEEPSRMAAPQLAEADSTVSLRIGYMPPAELGARHGGGLLEYELRYARWPGELARDGERGRSIDWEGKDIVYCPRWWAPPHGLPPPVRVTGLLTGRKYVFQIRAFSESGIGLWSDESQPCATLPSIPDRPTPVVKTPGLDSPFTAQIRLALPQANGSAITDCKLRFLGPGAADWQDFAEVWAGQCQVSKVPRAAEEGLDLMEPWQHLWDYTVLHFDPGKQYRFMYLCKNDVGESAWSDPSDPITTDPHVPERCTPPYLASRDDQSPTSLALHWDPPYDSGAEITHYTLHWTGNPKFQGHKVVDHITEPRYTLEGLSPNRPYFFKVAATNAVGRGRFSDSDAYQQIGCARTCAAVPSQPQNLEVRAVERVPGAVYLSWDRPRDDGGASITGYRVFYSRTETFDDACHFKQKAVRECKLVDLRPDTPYYFKVVAFNDTGDGPGVGPTAARTNPVPPAIYIPPRRPEPPTLKLLQDGSELSVSWTCPEQYDRETGFIFDEAFQTHPILSYRVQLIGYYPDVDSADHFLESDEVLQLRDPRSRPRDHTNTASFRALRGARHYRAFVQAFSEAGASGWSLPSQVIRSPANVPDPVPDLQLVGSTPSALRVEWTCPPGNGEEVTHFLLGWAEHEVLPGWRGGRPAAPGEAGVAAEWEGGSGLRKLPLSECSRGAGRCGWEICLLQPASYYLVSIRAASIVGNSAEAALGPVRTASVPPGPPGVARGVGSTQTSVSFTWEAPAYLGGDEVIGYEVRWLVVRPGGLVPAELEGVLTEDVRWVHLRQDGRLPHELQAVVEGGQCAESAQLGPQRTHVVEGMHTGDFLLPIVRARNAAGLGPWSRLPSSGLEVQGLCTLPAPPAPLRIAPRIERADGVDHRPYSLNAHWTCPDACGQPVRLYTLRFRQVGAPEGSLDDPLAGSGHVHEVRVRHPGGREWGEGDAHSLAGVHVGLTPGAHYVLQVRATSELGDSPDWGVASVPILTPPDAPMQPAAPTSPWQWPRAIQVAWADPWTRGAPLETCRLVYSMSPAMEDAVEVPCEVANEKFKQRFVKVEDLGISTGYYFQVCARNSVGWSPWSPVSEQVFTRACRPAPPAAPTLESVAWDHMQVSWVPPSDHGAPILEYEILLVDQERVHGLQEVLAGADACEADEEREALVQGIPPKECRRLKVGDFRQPAAPDCAFAGLMGNLEYAVSVRAFNRIGPSDWGPALRVRTPPDVPARCPLPGLAEAQPAALRCEFRLPFDNGARVEAVELSWARISGPVDRHLALGGRGAARPRRLSGAVTAELPPPGPERAPPYGVGGRGEALIDGLEPGAYYDVRARARNAVGWGEASPVVRMLCAPGRPDAPGGLRHTNHTEAAALPGGGAAHAGGRPAGADEPSEDYGARQGDEAAGRGDEPRHVGPHSPRAVDFRTTGMLTRSEVVSVREVPGNSGVGER